MQALIDIILPVFVVIGAGYLSSRFKLIEDTHINAIMSFATRFAVPCLLFNAMSKLDLNIAAYAKLLGSFYIGAFCSYVAGVLGARFLFKRSWQDSIAIGFCCLFSNTLMLGIPISERAYGADSLDTNYRIVAFHTIFCLGIGITSMEIALAKGRSALSIAKTALVGMFNNALILGILAGILVNLTGLPIPSALSSGLEIISDAALPVALFAIGGILNMYKAEGDGRVIAMICAISLLLHPAISFSLASVFDLPQQELRSLIVTAAMAPGINTYLFAHLYQRAMRVAASAVLVGTAASILTTLFWLTVVG